MVAEDEGGGYAICRWALAEGGGYGSDPGVEQSKPEGGGTGWINIDTPYMAAATGIGKTKLYMSAMHIMQRKGSVADRKNTAPPWGESGA